MRGFARGTCMFVLASIGCASNARAFCRATTVDAQGDACGVCETAGNPLAWEHPDIEYTFNERGFPGLADAEVRGIFRDAVDQWQAVSCDGARVEVDLQAAAGTTALGVRTQDVSPQINVMGHLSGAEWASEDYDPHAFAQTGVRYYKSGVIAGADIWFNGGMGKFGVCPAAGCRAGDTTIDLPNVITHEMGHFLGLAHSHVEEATMACEASPGDTDKRSLAADDRQGMCAMYPPKQAFQGPYQAGMWTKAKTVDACSVAAPGAAGRGFGPSTLGLGLVALAWLRRRRSLGLAAPTAKPWLGCADVTAQAGRGSS